jgi:hypothetical protein
MRQRTSLRLLLFGGGVLVLAVVGVIAFIAVSQGVPTGHSASVLRACSPKPCLDVQNFTMWVSNVREADGLVRMDVTFQNASDATHADPSDLQLVDANHEISRAVQDPSGCSHWSRTEFANGGKLGPLTICFHPASTAAPLTLRWSADFGLFCCQADLAIK